MVDYERIWKLSTTYWVDDFQMNVLYTVGFPHFILPPHGGETVGRAGGGKIIKTKQQRADDARRTARLHPQPENLLPPHVAGHGHPVCHRTRRRDRLPEDFAGMLRYLADYEAVHYEYSPEGTQVCDALFDQFCAKWFPGPLRPLGRTMILALLDEPAHRVHRLPHVRPATRRAVELGLKLTFLLKEKVLPDPKLSTPERKRRKLSRKPGFRAPQHETVDTGLGVT
jgi:hypothetical protein